jgi:hypothetical protein
MIFFVEQINTESKSIGCGVIKEGAQAEVWLFRAWNL